MTTTASPPMAAGILGTGTMARTMAATLKQSPDFTIAAVASGHDPARAEVLAEALPDRPRALASRDALLEEAGLRLVYIASASTDHEADAIAALEAGKDVLVEKPLALEAAGAERIEAAARAAGRFCMEAMWTPFLPAWIAAEERAKDLGDPRHLAFSFGYPVDPGLSPRLFAPGPGAGVLLDRGIYGVALALRLLGPAQRVSAHLSRGETGIDTEAALQIGHEAGGVSQIAVSMVSLLSNTATIGCTSGLVMLEAPILGSESLSVRHMSAAAAGGGATGLKTRLRTLPALRRLKALRARPERRRAGWGTDMYLPMLSHVAGCLREGRTESDRMPLSSSHAALDILDRARAGAAAKSSTA